MPKGERAIIDYEKIYYNKFDGPYIILEELPQDKHNNRWVRVKFLETGNIQNVLLGNALNGSIRDKTKREIIINNIYHSRSFGDFKVLRRMPNGQSFHKMYEIEFISTGTIKVVRACDIRSGNIRDDFMPNVAGVGYIGNGSSYDPAYNMWASMISRCYNQNDKAFSRYGAKGITVCERWHNFENFKADLPLLDGYDSWMAYPGKYALDKDKNQFGKPYENKVYSPNTCRFLSIIENTKIARKEKTIDKYKPKIMCEII